MDEDGRRRLGRLILRGREARGWERKDLANETGLSYPYVAQIENGDREPSLRALQSLAAALALPVSDLTSALEVDAPGVPPAASRYVANPAYAKSSAPAPPPPPGSLRRARGSSARRSLVAEVHELMERVDPLERLAVIGELQGLVLADVVRAEVNNRLAQQPVR